MSTMLFVSLPVADITRSREFFAAVGFRFEDAFSDAGTLCLVVNAGARVLLHHMRRFAGYAACCPDALAAASHDRLREAVVAVSAQSRPEVDRRIAAAIAHGAHELRAPLDLDGVYTRAFTDPDGHAWELVWLDPSRAARRDESRARPDDQAW